MTALLDTHAFLWWVMADSRLSPLALTFIQEPTNRLYLSAASGWEIANKAAIGKLTLPSSADQFVRGEMVFNRIQSLPVSMEHALHGFILPLLHKDPFDRILVAQSYVENLPIVSGDPLIRQYSVQVV